MGNKRTAGRMALMLAGALLLAGCREPAQPPAPVEHEEELAEEGGEDTASVTADWSALPEEVLTEAGDSDLIVHNVGHWRLTNALPDGFDYGVVVEGYYARDRSNFVLIPKYEDTTIEIFSYDHSGAQWGAYDSGEPPEGSHPVYLRAEKTRSGVSGAFFLIIPFQYGGNRGFGVKATWDGGEALYYFGMYEEYWENAATVQSLFYQLEVPSYTQYAQWSNNSRAVKENESILATVVNGGLFMPEVEDVSQYGDLELPEGVDAHQFQIYPRYLESTLTLYRTKGAERDQVAQWYDEVPDALTIPLPADGVEYLMTVEYGGKTGTFAFDLGEGQVAVGAVENVYYRLSRDNLGYYTIPLKDPAGKTDGTVIDYNSYFSLVEYLDSNDSLLLGSTYGMGGESLVMAPAICDLSTGDFRPFYDAMLDGYSWGSYMDGSRLLAGIARYSDDTVYNAYAIQVFDYKAGQSSMIPMRGQDGSYIFKEEDGEFGAYSWSLDIIYDAANRQYLWFYAQRSQLEPLTEMYCARIAEDGQVLSNQNMGILCDIINILWGVGQRPMRFILDGGLVYFPSVLIEYDENERDNAKVGPTMLAVYDPSTNQVRRTEIYDGQEAHHKGDDYQQMGRNIRLITDSAVYFIANKQTCHAIGKHSGEILSQYALDGEENTIILDVYATPDPERVLFVYSDGAVDWHDARSLEWLESFVLLEENETAAGVDALGSLIVVYTEGG